MPDLSSKLIEAIKVHVKRMPTLDLELALQIVDLIYSTQQADHAKRKFMEMLIEQVNLRGKRANVA